MNKKNYLACRDLPAEVAGAEALAVPGFSAEMFSFKTADDGAALEPLLLAATFLESDILFMVETPVRVTTPLPKSSPAYK